MKKEKAKKLTTKIQNLKSNHAITLIALIITIVVMLILVAVTLTIALGENGIVNNAKEAKEKTEIVTEKEQLLDAVFATVGSSGEVKLEDIVLPEGFTEVSRDGNKITYQGPSGKQFEVENVTGKITEIIETEPEGDGGGEEINPVVGTYYSPGNSLTLVFDEEGSMKYLFGSEILLQLDYEYDNESGTITCVGDDGMNWLLHFIEFADNKILLNEGEVLLAMNRNGLEGEEIAGRYRMDGGPSDDDLCLTIDSRTGTYVIESANFGSGLDKETGYYYYYNNYVYKDDEEGLGSINLNSGNWIEE